MGKKSRRNRAKKPENSSAGFSGWPSIWSIKSRTSESAFARPSFAKETPENGWGRESREAEKELRHDSRNPDAILRAARAARVMRQFDRLQKIMDKAESKGVSIGGGDNQKLWGEWKAECASYKSARSILKDPFIQDFCSDVMNNRECGVDPALIDHEVYSDLTALQYAAAAGDVSFLEKLVSLGAALDYEHGESSQTDVIAGQGGGIQVRKPPGTTALLLAVVGALVTRYFFDCFGDCADFDHEEMRDLYEGQIECAIQLVRLGANVDLRLELPSGRDANSKTYVMMKEMKWAGKTIRELARDAGSGPLVQTIQQFDSEDEKIKLANCRCGSRLPWKECHAGKKTDWYFEKRAGKIIWRYSPLAHCPCRNSHKTHFKCCWDETFRVYFRDDETTQMPVCYRAMSPMTESLRSSLSFLAERDDTKHINIFEGKSHDDIRKMLCDTIRKHGQDLLKEMSEGFHPKSRMGAWDPNVVAGVMECMEQDDFFQWNDVHWNIPKPELLDRVKVWNDALKKYCDRVGLAGAGRDKVVKLHSASPFAPCANMNCEKIESRVKEFARCSRCLRVGYCSDACLREDWPFHKTGCRW